MPDEVKSYDTDRQGFVTLRKGTGDEAVEAKVVPESVEVWTKRGWDIVDSTPSKKSEGK